jgi:hypothetical protein
MNTKRQYVLDNAPPGVFTLSDLPAEYARIVHEMYYAGRLNRVGRGRYERSNVIIPVTLKQHVRQNLPSGVFSVNDLARHLPPHPSERASLNMVVHHLVREGTLHRAGPRLYSTNPDAVFEPKFVLRQAILELVSERGEMQSGEVVAAFPEACPKNVRSTVWSLWSYGLLNRVKRPGQRHWEYSKA